LCFKKAYNWPPFFSFVETINSERYCSQILLPFIVQLNEDEINNTFFQQGGATAHTTHRSMELLEEVFRECLLSWPPRSPDFIFWGAAKSQVYVEIIQEVSQN
jgi:hypothetical protein